MKTLLSIQPSYRSETLNINQSDRAQLTTMWKETMTCSAGTITNWSRIIGGNVTRSILHNTGCVMHP